MRRLWIGIGLVVMLVGAMWMPVAAQGDFTPEEQAALDDVRAAFENWLALETYSATLDQTVTQDIAIDIMGQAMTLVQTIEAKGETQVEAVPGSAVPNQMMALTETITQDMKSMGESQVQEIGPVEVGVITVDDHIYMRMTMPDEMSGFLPVGWQDVTGDASAFGMQSFDMQQMFQLSASTLNSDYLDTVLSSTLAVELLGEDTLDGVPVNRYRLALDVSSAVEALGGLGNMEQAFGDGLGIDMEAMLEQIYDPENSSFAFELAIGVDDQMVYEYTVHMVTDIVLTEDMITDMALAGSEMTINQDLVSTLLVYGFNEPVTIEAPELGE
jgi:hypothetical protein